MDKREKGINKRKKGKKKMKRQRMESQEIPNNNIMLNIFAEH